MATGTALTEGALQFPRYAAIAWRPLPSIAPDLDAGTAIARQGLSPAFPRMQGAVAPLRTALCMPSGAVDPGENGMAEGTFAVEDWLRDGQVAVRTGHARKRDVQEHRP
jgi:hypothetical protein